MVAPSPGGFSNEKVPPEGLILVGPLVLPIQKSLNIKEAD